MDWSKIADTLQKLPTYVKEEFGPLAIWVGLVAPAISAGIGSQLSATSTAFLLIIYYLLVGLLATISRYTKLETKQARKIEILWGDKHPYVHYDGEIEILWRVGVYNESPVSSVCDVEVRISDMEQGINVFIPAPLHIMGDNPPNKERYQIKTDIHPNDTTYFDVIGQLSTHELFIYYADKVLTQRLPIREGSAQYRLTIKVVGRDMPARARDFKTYMDANDKLVMEPVTESYEPIN